MDVTGSLFQRIYHRVMQGGGQANRRRRYVMVAIAAIGTVWLIALAYVAFAPRSYTSSFTLILPGTGAGSTVNLESLGQATSTSASPFSSPDISPTENYRKMLLSRVVLRAAAGQSGDTETGFPTPKIELTDQTKLIQVNMRGRNPDQAFERATALKDSFMSTLDSLRADEIAKRDSVFRTTLAGYKSQLDDARQKLIDHEAKTGLVSLEQYGGMVSSIEHLREQARDADAKLTQSQHEAETLAATLGTTPELASIAMVLRADPQFQSLMEQLSKEEADLAAVSATHGPNNPKLIDMQAEDGATQQKLATRGMQLTGRSKQDIVKMRDLSIRDERGQLFQHLIAIVAEGAGLAGMRDQLHGQIESEQKRVMGMTQDASHLDDLRRDVQVAEAVFSSALARTDISKADFYASYPMAQILEPPDLPKKPSSPMTIVALGGALGASFFISLGLGFAWLRMPLLRKVLKSA